MSDHSKYFSPSAAKTWLACPGSAILNADKENKSNVHSDRGTALHDFCAKNFFTPREDVDYSGLDEGDRTDVKKALEMAWSIEDSMTEPLVLIEERGEVIGAEDIFGTIDLVFWSEFDDHLVIADYKFGYGPVEPETPQLRIYGHAAFNIFRKKNPAFIVGKVTTAIIQPRQSSKAQMATFSWEEMVQWRYGTLNPGYEAILGMAGKPITELVLTPGEAQCKWCRSAKDASCPALNAQVEELLASVPHNEEPLDLTLEERLRRVPLMRLIADAIEEEAFALLNKGGKIPGFKLVRGRSNRAWADKEKTEKFLAARGLKEKERYNWSVIGIPAAEALLADKLTSTKLQNAFQALIVKPEGKLTIAPESDKRSAIEINTAQELLQGETDELDDL